MLPIVLHSTLHNNQRNKYDYKYCKWGLISKPDDLMKDIILEITRIERQYRRNDNQERGDYLKMTYTMRESFYSDGQWKWMCSKSQVNDVFIISNFPCTSILSCLYHNYQK